MQPTLEQAYLLVHGHKLMTGKPAVLVVEDDYEILSSVAKRIREEGFEVITAGNGWQALDQAKLREVSLILLDLKMPVMGGAELVKRLRERGCHAPVVLVSGAVDLVGEAALLGAEGMLAKPFVLEDIARVVHEHCKL